MKTLSGGMVLFAMEAMHDMQVSLSTTFYTSVIAYVLYNTSFSVPEISGEYLSGIGLTSQEITEIQTDTTYGWSSYESSQIWVQAYLDYQNSGSLDIGAFDVIRNYFQMPELQDLFLNNGSISWEIEKILNSTLKKYGTNDPVELACLQWSNATVSRDLPMDIGPLPNVSDNMAFPSFLSLNQSLNFIPEMYWFLENSNIPGLDYTPYAQNLIDVQYTYPNTNFASIINIQNLAFFFTELVQKNYTAVMQRFGLANPSLIAPLAAYIQSTAVLPLVTPDGLLHPLDSYSLTLSRWGQKALTLSISQLRSDLFWAVHARNLFGNYTATGTSCEHYMQTSGIAIAAALLACTDSGCDIAVPATWTSLIVWIKAASKDSGSSEFVQIAQESMLNPSELETILFTGTPCILSDLQTMGKFIAEYYSCARTVCTYDEMVWMQWSGAVFTNNLTQLLVDAAVTPSNSIYSWLPKSYFQPFEWPNYSTLTFPVSLAKQLINYNNFLSPNAVKLFFNSYFQGDLVATAKQFNLPSDLYTSAFYSYFQSIVPGSGLFYTSPFHTWIDGFMHPFLSFLYQINIFEGGNPLAYPFYTVGGNSTDSHTAPRTVMVSGKSNVKKTRNYYLYYGSRYSIKYGASLCVFCPYALNYTVSNVWPVEHILNATDGGKFPNGFSKNDDLFAYVDLIKKNVKLTYSSSSDYYSLPVYKYVVAASDFATAATVPENAGYNQLAWGLNGFYNLTSSYGFPFFMSKPHFYGCDPVTSKMATIYQYTPSNPMTVRITANSSDEPYLLINAETGASVKLRFKIMGSTVIYGDYYFNTIVQPGGANGLFFPYYLLMRYSDWTESMISNHFGALIEAHFLEKILFFLGIIGGAFFIQISLMIAVFLRRYKRRMHHKKLSLAIRTSIDKRTSIDRRTSMDKRTPPEQK